MLSEDTAVSKLWKILIQKCYVMNNKEKLFNKTILGGFVFINEENKRKQIQGKNVLSLAKYVLGGFWLGVFCPGGFCWGVYVWKILSGGFVLIPYQSL